MNHICHFNLGQCVLDKICLPWEYYDTQQNWPTWVLSLTEAAALVNNSSEVPLLILCSDGPASPLLTFSWITTLSLRFCPKTNPEVPDAGWAGVGVGTWLEFLGAAPVVPSGTNFGVSALVSLSLSSVSVLSDSLSGFLVTSSVSVTFRNGLLLGFSWDGRRIEPGM